LLEYELGRAIPNGGIEFSNQFSPPTFLVPYDVALACLDQPKAVSGVEDLQTYMQKMNATSSQVALGRFGVASREVFCSST
jgi:hypothetical protein